MNKPRLVLVVEDDEDDLFLFKHELKKVGVSGAKHAADGQAAVDYLAGNGPFEDRSLHPLPDVVFLDLKIPHLNGHEVLEWIRSQPGLEALRVYVLTGSDEPKDRDRAAAAGATGYFVKPLEAARLKQLFA